MKNDIKTILEKVLTLIAYQKDKNAFINEFLNLCMQTTLADYIQLFPEERKKELRQILQTNDQTKLQEQLEPYLVTEEYSKLLHKNIDKLLKDYYQTIMPTLSKEQKDSLNSYFESLQVE